MLSALLLCCPATAQEMCRVVCFPLQNVKTTSGFGHRVHPVTGQADFHRGIDLRARREPVYNIMDGTVSATGEDPFLGRFVRVVHGEFTSIYGHLSLIAVAQGEQLPAGAILGITGATGRTTGEHLHFSLKFRSGHIDPITFFRAFLPDQ